MHTFAVIQSPLHNYVIQNLPNWNNKHTKLARPTVEIAIKRCWMIWYKDSAHDAYIVKLTWNRRKLQSTPCVAMMIWRVCNLRLVCFDHEQQKFTLQVLFVQRNMHDHLSVIYGLILLAVTRLVYDSLGENNKPSKALYVVGMWGLFLFRVSFFTVNFLLSEDKYHNLKALERSQGLTWFGENLNLNVSTY